jgi:hypothetical protein
MWNGFRRVRLMIGVAVWAVSPVLWAQASNCCKLSEPQPPVQNTFKVSGAPELAVSNINGPIHVIGDSNGEIRLSAIEIVRGNSNDDIARAKREVHLYVRQDGNRVFACVSAPLHHGRNGDNGACRDSNIGDVIGDVSDWLDFGNHYSVRFDFELHVPPVTRVALSTIDEGDIKVELVSGGFELNNVNGGIELDAAAGSGEARTVNGEVMATFAANPRAGCLFSTVNGSVHMYFRPGLSAQLSYKTLNGEVYSDFPVSPAGGTGDGVPFLPGGFGSGHVGSGGPQIHFNTLNGNIFIHRSS